MCVLNNSNKYNVIQIREGFHVVNIKRDIKQNATSPKLTISFVNLHIINKFDLPRFVDSLILQRQKC